MNKFLNYSFPSALFFWWSSMFFHLFIHDKYRWLFKWLLTVRNSVKSLKVGWKGQEDRSGKSKEATVYSSRTLMTCGVAIHRQGTGQDLHRMRVQYSLINLQLNKPIASNLRGIREKHMRAHIHTHAHSEIS